MYLPVRVSTGATTQGMTEITSGVEEKRGALVLDDARLFGAERHQPDAARNIEPAPSETKHATIIDDTDYGEDPYAEPE